jgi:undecaprenyl-diphosphatase
MNYFQSFILGIVQGLTEFLPISSSAHLVVVPFLFGWELDPEVAFLFDILVQAASLFAVVYFFYHDLLRLIRQFVQGIIQRKPFGDPDSRLAWLIIAATIPAGLTGFFLKDQVEAAFNSIRFVGLALVINSIILFTVERVGQRNRNLGSLTIIDSIWVGIAQVFAIFPGISRSGATISGGMFRNLERTSAARFSFLLSIPVLTAAGLFTAFDLMQSQEIASQFLVFLPGILSSAIVSYLSIRFLLNYLMKHSLNGFAVYCGLIGVLIYIIYSLR